MITKTSTLDDFPIDLWIEITLYLFAVTPKDLIAFSCINHFFYNLRENQDIEFFFKTKVGTHFNPVLKKGEKGLWRQFFYAVQKRMYRPLTEETRALFFALKENHTAYINHFLETVDDDTLISIELQKDVNGIRLLNLIQKIGREVTYSKDPIPVMHIKQPRFQQIFDKYYAMRVNAVEENDPDLIRIKIALAFRYHQSNQVFTKCIEEARSQAVNLFAPDFFMKTENRNPNFLFYCVQYHPFIENNVELMQLFLEDKPNLQQKDAQGDTLLHLAAKAADPAVLHLLIQQGANIEVLDRCGWTPLFNALNKYRNALFLYAQNAKLNHQTEAGFNLLMAAANHCRSRRLFKWILKQNFDLEKRDSDGSTALHYAAGEKEVWKVALLLKKGARVDAQNKWGYTPLATAILCNREEIVKLLIKAGANVNHRTHQKIPLLNLAIDMSTSIMELLLEHKANPNIDDATGRTPLNYAILQPLKVKLLLQYNACPALASQNWANVKLSITDKFVDRENFHQQSFKLINEQWLKNMKRNLQYNLKSQLFEYTFFKQAMLKMKAMQALVAVIFDNAETSCLDAHWPCYQTGELKALYQALCFSHAEKLGGSCQSTFYFQHK